MKVCRKFLLRFGYKIRFQNLISYFFNLSRSSKIHSNNLITLFSYVNNLFFQLSYSLSRVTGRTRMSKFSYSWMQVIYMLVSQCQIVVLYRTHVKYGYYVVEYQMRIHVELHVLKSSFYHKIYTTFQQRDTLSRSKQKIQSLFDFPQVENTNIFVISYWFHNKGLQNSIFQNSCVVQNRIFGANRNIMIKGFPFQRNHWHIQQNLFYSLKRVSRSSNSLAMKQLNHFCQCPIHLNEVQAPQQLPVFAYTIHSSIPCTLR
eukprot:TRINITY_DN2550_c0_g1_i5.p1 TRINITY_DN2550_c0_g1~~TRINITY_DN2550_c0_g1_i5.p1  ORF type:complete len:259 (+),score=-38.25 TRINITY_DN2550_c0_g1_i5:257-1033(+)